MPRLPASLRTDRAFLEHVVRHLVVERGITQLLDLGSGVPTAGNVHEVAQAADPAASVVYVDIDQVAVAHTRALLFAVPHSIPDTRLARQVVRAFVDPLAPGSHLALSHGAPGHAAPQAQADAVRDCSSRTGVPFTSRTAEQIGAWLTGLEIQPPGLRDIRVRLPELDAGRRPISPVLGALAGKPCRRRDG